MQKYTVAQFDGGIADAYLSATPNRCSVADNLFIDENGKPQARAGFKVFGTRVPTTSGSRRVSGIVVDTEPFGRPFFFRGDKQYYINEVDGITEVTGPTGNPALPNKTQSDWEKSVTWRKQLIYTSSPATCLPARTICTTYSPTAVFKSVTLGLPQPANPTAVAASGTGNNWVYSFHYYYTFTDYEGTVFEESGPVIEASVAADTTTIDPGTWLVNTSSTNYDTANLKMRIYRTITNGTTSYLLTTLAYGAAPFVDSATDASIVNNTVLYTDGGVLERTAPPAGSYYCTQVNDFFWYATDKFVTHSIQGAPGAAPAEYYEYLPQRIKGLSNVIGFPVLFCDRSVYRIDGNYDEFGDGGFDLREITSIAGCAAHRSIVQIPGGLVWAGNGGFYFTDGYQVKKISEHLNTRYATWKNASITGTYDAQRNIVVWTINSSSNSTTAPNDSMAVLYLRYGISEMSVFNTWSAKNNIFPTCLAYSESSDVPSAYRARLLMGDALGYFYWQDDLTYTDPWVSEAAYPSAWTKKPVIYRFESAGLDFGDDSVRKYCSEFTTELRNETDIAIQFGTRVDDGGPFSAFSEVRKDGAILWGISEYAWNDSADSALHDWNAQGVVEQRNNLPANTMRSNRRQISFTNSLTYIAKSDTLGTATTQIVSPTLKTLTLDTVGKVWESDCEGYEIGVDWLSNGTYTYYQVRARTSDTVITVFDPYSTFQTLATRKWQIRGYRKFERLFLLSFTVWFDLEGPTQLANRGNAAFINT